MKLSLIIPYYNTYELTIKLLDILIPQLTDEVEVFLVDDGCHETRLDQFEKIRVIHIEENKGNSAAINAGIRLATGKYLGIIDSDDLITEDYIKEIISAIDTTDAEILILDWKDMHSGDVVHRPSNYAPWRSLYRKDIMVLFDESIRHCNDVPFRKALDEDHKSKYYIDKVLYIYNSNRVGSLTWEAFKGGDFS